MASHLRIDSGSSIYKKYRSNSCSYHSLCSWSQCERSPLRVHRIPLQSQNFITVLSLRLITHKILISLTSAITKREVCRAKQMSETRECWKVGRYVRVHVAANHVSTLLAALWCSAAHHRCVDRKERKERVVLARLPEDTKLQGSIYCSLDTINS